MQTEPCPLCDAPILKAHDEAGGNVYLNAKPLPIYEVSEDGTARRERDRNGELVLRHIHHNRTCTAWHGFFESLAQEAT